MADDFQYVKLPNGEYGKFAGDANDDVIRTSILKDFPHAYDPDPVATRPGVPKPPTVGMHKSYMVGDPDADPDHPTDFASRAANRVQSNITAIPDLIKRGSSDQPPTPEDTAATEHFRDMVGGNSPTLLGKLGHAATIGPRLAYDQVSGLAKSYSQDPANAVGDAATAYLTHQAGGALEGDSGTVAGAAESGVGNMQRSSVAASEPAAPASVPNLTGLVKRQPATPTTQSLLEDIGGVVAPTLSKRYGSIKSILQKVGAMGAEANPPDLPTPAHWGQGSAEGPPVSEWGKQVTPPTPKPRPEPAWKGQGQDTTGTPVDSIMEKSSADPTKLADEARSAIKLRSKQRQMKAKNSAPQGDNSNAKTLLKKRNNGSNGKPSTTTK